MASSETLLPTDQSLNGDKTGCDEAKAKEAQIHARRPRFHILLEKHKDTMMSSSSSSGPDNQGNNRAWSYGSSSETSRSGRCACDSYWKAHVLREVCNTKLL